jgi:hypothetical protein
MKDWFLPADGTLAALQCSDFRHGPAQHLYQATVTATVRREAARTDYDRLGPKAAELSDATGRQLSEVHR